MLNPIQLLQKLFHRTPIASLRQLIHIEQIVEYATAIQQIPAPTFAEHHRAAFVRERFEQSLLCNVSLDVAQNVYGRWPGDDPNRSALLLSAHLDTVFPTETDLSLRHDHGLVYGPGLGDNSLGVAALLTLLDIFKALSFQPPCDIWFVANSREEGLGDLGGIRAVWHQLGTRLGAGLVIEGMGLGRIYHAGIGVRRLHITCTAAGGHSWLHFGQPSAIHGLIELGSDILTLHLPSQPRTTYNIGLINGGQSVNSLAACADLYLDLRSEAPDTLRALEQQVLEKVEKLRRNGLSFASEVVGDRPAGQISIHHPLAQLAAAVLESVGQRPAFESGSTDANLLLSVGLPAVTIGITRGGNAHRLDEFIETEPISSGIEQLALLILAVTDQMSGWSR